MKIPSGRRTGACVVLLMTVLLAALSPVPAYTVYSECDRFARGDCTEARPTVYNGYLRVAVAQTASNSTATLEANAAKHAAWVAKAAAEQARAIVFPEMSMTGYFAERVVTLAGPNGSAAVANARLRAAEDVVAAACTAGNMYCFIGIPVFHGDVNATAPRPWYNTVLVIAPDGSKMYRQAKLYPCCTQDGDAGTWLDTFNITNYDGTELPVALQICFDDFHPEIVRLQAIAGAQILFYSSWESDVSLEQKLGLGDKLGSAQAVVNSHAALNQMFILQANAGALVDTMVTEFEAGYMGPADGGSHGQSRVVDPWGATLEECRVFGEQLIVHDLDLSLLFPQNHRMAMGSLSSATFGAMYQEGMKALGNRMPIEW